MSRYEEAVKAKEDFAYAEATARNAFDQMEIRISGISVFGGGGSGGIPQREATRKDLELIGDINTAIGKLKETIIGMIMHEEKKRLEEKIQLAFQEMAELFSPIAVNLQEEMETLKKNLSKNFSPIKGDMP